MPRILEGSQVSVERLISASLSANPNGTAGLTLLPVRGRQPALRLQEHRGAREGLCFWLGSGSGLGSEVKWWIKSLQGFRYLFIFSTQA